MKLNHFEIEDSTEKIVQSLKEGEKTNEFTRINLIKMIYNHIYTKKYELALKMCDYYLIKYSETLFLNHVVYIMLAEIYNMFEGFEYSRLFYEKALTILCWQFSVDNPALIEIYYSFALIMLKQVDLNELYEEIFTLLEKATLLAEKVSKYIIFLISFMAKLMINT